MSNDQLSTEIHSHKLKQIKLVHTTIWAFMAAAIVAVPWAARHFMFRLAAGLTSVILGECLVLALNGGRCPLTDIAARYTDERADNFDIYLPLWLARYNKRIFGFLFVAGEIILLWQWIRRPIS